MYFPFLFVKWNNQTFAIATLDKNYEDNVAVVTRQDGRCLA